MNETVLIIDDSLTVRMNLKEAFDGAGFRTRACASAAEALKALAGGEIALILLDVQLPDADGLTLLKRLRSEPSTRGIPVIMLTSEIDLAHRSQGIAEGADEYIGKPYDVSYVLAKAHELLARANPSSANERARPLVLVIDDSATYREALRASLLEHGFGVETAPSGEEGLRLAARVRPNALIVDGNLPGIDGPTVVRRIKSDVALRSMPCLLLTASEDRSDEARALDAGADSYARKSDDADGIIARLCAILKSSSQPLHTSEKSLLSPKRVLAVDDSLTYVQALAEPLREEGYDVITAQSGEEALSLLALQEVDCILLDRMMPGISGEEVCRKIKADARLRDTPVLVLTAYEGKEAMLESFSAGADDYIPKSNDFDVLKARVRAQLRRKQFEDESRRVREELARKEKEAAQAWAHRELAETRARLLKDLETANRELESFSYSVSHDLRAPLRAILGFGRILLEDYAPNLDAAGQGHVTRIIDAAKNMSQLVDGLLELSQLSRHELKVETLDLSELVDAIALQLAERDPGRKVTWEVGRGVRAPGDPRLLRAVLENLLANAWKYSSKRAEARIQFGETSCDGRLAYFVRDNGAGFDMRYAQKLFGAFQRLHSTNEFEGTGIGLASVQRIIHRHGGKIWAEAKVGEGACFYFTLKNPAEADYGVAVITAL